MVGSFLVRFSIPLIDKGEEMCIDRLGRIYLVSTPATTDVLEV